MCSQACLPAAWGRYLSHMLYQPRSKLLNCNHSLDTAGMLHTQKRPTCVRACVFVCAHARVGAMSLMQLCSCSSTPVMQASEGAARPSSRTCMRAEAWTSLVCHLSPSSSSIANTTMRVTRSDVRCTYAASPCIRRVRGASARITPQLSESDIALLTSSHIAPSELAKAVGRTCCARSGCSEEWLKPANMLMTPTHLKVRLSAAHSPAERTAMQWAHAQALPVPDFFGELDSPNSPDRRFRSLRECCEVQTTVDLITYTTRSRLCCTLEYGRTSTCKVPS